MRAPALCLSALCLSALCLSALCLLAPAAHAEPAIDATSRIILRLDPRAPRDPRGTVGVGLFRLAARGDLDVEASGWIAHAPHAPESDGAAVTGTVSTLRLRAPLGPAWVELGRHYNAIGGWRLTPLDGLSAGLALSEHLDLAARAGLGLPLLGDPLGETVEFGAEARLRLPDARVSLGVQNSRAEDVPVRTRWTLAADIAPGPDLSAAGAVTADVVERAVVDARLELAARPLDPLRLRGYGRYARVDALLPPGDLLAAFAPDPRGEVGALAEYTVDPRWRLRLDGAWAGVREADFGARWRAAVEWLPGPGAWATLEGTARIERHGYSGLARIAGRWPIRGTLFATAEALADAEDHGEATDLGAVARLGAGFAPADDWLVYAALDAAHTPRWTERLGGVVLVEYTLGAPVQWGAR